MQVHINLYTDIYTYIYMYIYMGIDTIAYRDKCTDTYDNARIYTNKLAYMHIYAYVQAYIHTGIHTNIHTYIQIQEYMTS